MEFSSLNELIVTLYDAGSTLFPNVCAHPLRIVRTESSLLIPTESPESLKQLKQTRGSSE